jgi:hypothetical protein
MNRGDISAGLRENGIIDSRNRILALEFIFSDQRQGYYRAIMCLRISASGSDGNRARKHSRGLIYNKQAGLKKHRRIEAPKSTSVTIPKGGINFSVPQEIRGNGWECLPRPLRKQSCYINANVYALKRSPSACLSPGSGLWSLSLSLSLVKISRRGSPLILSRFYIPKASNASRVRGQRASGLNRDSPCIFIFVFRVALKIGSRVRRSGE